MKKLTVLFMLIAGAAVAQPRQLKDICTSLGGLQEVDPGPPPVMEFVGCEALDSDEVILLKRLYNKLWRDRRGLQKLRQEYTGAAKLAARLASYNARIAKLRTVRDAVTNQELKEYFGDKINDLQQERERLHSTRKGSNRAEAILAQAEIQVLNAQMDDIDDAIEALE